ncbi:hypothetical protein Clacol_009416 [Clathrus columnatus]|uniref:Uncharacterized protein n=1 Tax=Clathrus columnatus TaxID=1419009 RepID=A0AAV5AS11_9AGAM|nr:hypothetical protein Clacol_009416 [Clathrus columnatus]
MTRTDPPERTAQLQPCVDLSETDLTDHLGFGKEKRRQGNLDILAGKTSFRDGFREMLESIPNTFDECAEVLKNNRLILWTDIKLDEGFKDFYKWTNTVDIPVIIVSSGMAPLIRAVLSKLIGEKDAKDIEIISNHVNVEPSGKWHIQFRHPTSGFGHDKSQAILPYRNLPEPPLLFFFGDGVSDMSAARHADVLFVKKPPGKESDLATYCEKEGIPHILFENFNQALPMVQAIVEGSMSVQEALKKGRTF